MNKSAYRAGYYDGFAGNERNPFGPADNGSYLSFYASGYRDGESDRLLRVNAKKEPSANPESVSPYDSGYADGLAGIPGSPIGLASPSQYSTGYSDGAKARERHLVPETADSRPAVESDGNTEESAKESAEGSVTDNPDWWKGLATGRLFKPESLRVDASYSGYYLQGFCKGMQERIAEGRVGY